MSLAVRYVPDEVRDLEQLWTGDVLVVGGGSAGCSAAIAAAREGARTLLVEAGGFLGGTGAAVLDTFYGFYAPGGEERVVEGIAWELCERLLASGQAFERPNTYGAGTGVTYDPEALKRTWDKLLADAGAPVLHHARVVAVVAAERRVVGAIVETKAGPRLVSARVLIDATGDAELAWRAGASVDRPADENRTQPLTMTFRLGGVDVARTSTPELHRLMAEAAESGRYELPRREGSSHHTVVPGVVHTNLTRVAGVDGTDPWQLSAAEQEGRRQVEEYVRFLVEQVPGYENACLLGTSVWIGIRETRRLRGRYILTRDDVLAARDFDDAIARCGAPLEDHAGGETTIWEYIGPDGRPSGLTYGIPYRCLVPIDVDCLLVAGRCLSATHDAHASVRSMAQCMAMGQAAGTAAALASTNGGDPAAVDAGVLRRRLAERGARL
jgi:glycine/D-amino acid oxidase-like deaminating enzyme